jgi:hypothetical protein
MFEISELHQNSSQLVRCVWRYTLNEPGFAVVRLPLGMASRQLRESMFRIVERFNQELNLSFVPERLGRFDQQVTTKFHRDGAPEASLLILGYEPSSVESRLFIADACRVAATECLGINEYLAANNPMFSAGEAKLRNTIQELLVPRDTGAIVIINNSLYPDAASSPVLGLLHKGEIVQPNPHATRVINSMGLTPDSPTVRRLTREDFERFLTRADLD